LKESPTTGRGTSDLKTIMRTVVKLSPAQSYPDQLEKGKTYQAQKESYRIFPIDVPLALVDGNWVAYADAIITKLTWEGKQTSLTFEIDRISKTPFLIKE
jgi:hypothetical protein